MKSKVELYSEPDYRGEKRLKEAKIVMQEIAKTPSPADTIAAMLKDHSLYTYFGYFANEYGYLKPEFKDQTQYVAELLAYIRLVDPQFRKNFVGDFHTETCAASKTLQLTDTTNAAILDFDRSFQSFNISEFMKLANSKFPTPKRKDLDKIVPQLIQATLERVHVPLALHGLICLQDLGSYPQTRMEQLIATSVFIPADKKEAAVSSLSKGINELTKNLQLYLIAWLIAQVSWKNFAQNEVAYNGWDNRSLRLFNPDEKERFAKIRSGVVTRVAKDEFTFLLSQSESEVNKILASPNDYIKSRNQAGTLNSGYIAANSKSNSITTSSSK